MADEILIFDVPTILENIGHHLDRNDLESLTVVNSAFYDSFKRSYWRELAFRMSPRPLAEPEDMEVDQRQALLDNCRWVRKLSVHSHMKRGDMLDLLSTRCTRLTDFTSYINLRGNKAHCYEDPSFAAILKIASNSEFLQRWSIVILSDFSPLTPEPLMDVISTRSHLTHLDFGIGSIACHGWLRRVLQTLPLSLKALWLRWPSILSDDDDWVDNFQDQGWPLSYPSLENVEMWVDLFETEEVVVAEFLRRCPALKALILPTMTSTQVSFLVNTVLGPQKWLPNLTALDLGMTEYMVQGDWDDLLLAMKGRIKCFGSALSHSEPSMRMFVPSMVSQWGDTLESVIIGQTLCVKSIDIHNILTRCPGLKRFECIYSRVMGPLGPGFDFWAPVPGDEAMPLLRQQYEEYEWVPWACQGLEVFKMMFTDSRIPTTDGAMCMIQEQCTRDATRYVYGQLGRLGKLEELVIGWRTRHEFADRCNLNMSLASGLDLMGGLESLKVLNFAHMHWPRFGEPEVEWMRNGGVWPRLEKIVGLRRHITSAGDNALPQYMLPLLEQRPHLKLE
ncbi:hypothetical protein B0O80DRAFT_495507 [Mortierella sp. GBAus27b]|nr:hypothetical protein BGX31_008595 [Mortierella sp. GBA43]KAI8358848.1 hypothetical protein B0O80DRAFT_495507 [Mortierella sp. GBAus27b]